MPKFICAISTILLIAGSFANAALVADSPAGARIVPLVIDATQRRDPVLPAIYSQFIEHLGRCIYGGIWAEMLEDRKFYFPITGKYAPYKSLTDTPFPVVGSSPWQIIGDEKGVSMEEKDAFVGEHSPQVPGHSGIRQRDLGVLAGKKYDGYIWLRAADGEAGPVSIALATDEAGMRKNAKIIPNVGAEFQRFAFEFNADKSTDHAMLEVKNEGTSPIIIGTLSLMPGDNMRGMRADTLELLKQLNASYYRWPGGNFVSGYDWRDGLGDRDRRPPRKNPAWTGVEHNDFGLDEYMDFCHEVGAAPLVTVNTGFGDDYSAAQEVEYCNAGADTIGGGWRAKNGHAAPFGVKLWCVGNEMFGKWQLGYMKEEQYVLKHNMFAAAMRRVDPSISLVGVGDLTGMDPAGDPGRKVPWSEGMLKACADSMDLISEHFYSGNLPWETAREIPILEHVGMLRKQIRAKAKGHRKLQTKLGLWPDRKVPIAMDEWNYWHRKYAYGELGCQYTLIDALGVAAGLHEYFRNTDVIHAASYAQTVNVIGCIKTTKTAAFLDTTALPLMIYRAHFGTIPVEVSGDFAKENVDAMAALTEDGGFLTIGVVNPNAEAVELPLETKGVNLAKTGTQWTVGGADPKATNDEHTMRVDVKESNVAMDAKWSVPAYSFAVLRIAVEK